MKKIFKYIIPAAALMLSVGMASCVNDLHVTPIDPSVQTDVTAEQLFNKCYANFGLPGNGGSDGDCDIDGIDGGTSGLYRQYWNSQELPTDEAICGWGDDGIATFCYNTYDASHPMLKGYYYRLCVGIAYCNQYLGSFGEANTTMSAEIRFLRAFQYYLLMDAFGNVPFTTTVSSEKPKQATRAELYSFIESELLAIIGEDSQDNTQVLADAAPHKNGEDRYGRVDKAAAWMLLARLYLNAEVYTGTAQWAKAETYSKKVIDSAYELNTTGSSKNVTTTDASTGTKLTQTWEFSPYQMLFMGDNDKTSAANEAIFPILSDGQRTTSWGVALFLIASTYDGDMHELRYDEFFADESSRSVNGVSGQAWGGNRARPQLIRKFFPLDDAPEGAAYETADAAGDTRALFDTKGRKLNVEDPSTFKNGYAVAKFTNFTTDGSATSSTTHPNMDVMMMRKAEAYLIYAEAKFRQGDATTAKEYVNIIRNRAQADPYTAAHVLTLDEILDENAREFYFEGHRRTDLIRFGYYGGNSSYKWQWKAGNYDGANFDKYRNIFAIPTSDITANKNLEQNDGYK